MIVIVSKHAADNAALIAREIVAGLHLEKLQRPV
jgi:hypothetical protein